MSCLYHNSEENFPSKLDEVDDNDLNKLDCDHLFDKDSKNKEQHGSEDSIDENSSKN